MRLVNNQRVVLIQKPVVLGFRQQNAVSHQFNQTFRAGVVAKTNLETNGFAQWLLQFFGDAVSHAASGDTARLGMTDITRHASARFQANLRQLGGLARTGLATNYHHLIFHDRF